MMINGRRKGLIIPQGSQGIGWKGSKGLMEDVFSSGRNTRIQEKENQILMVVSKSRVREQGNGGWAEMHKENTPTNNKGDENMLKEEVKLRCVVVCVQASSIVSWDVLQACLVQALKMKIDLQPFQQLKVYHFIYGSLKSKKIRDCCGAFIEVDRQTENLKNLFEAIIRVKVLKNTGLFNQNEKGILQGEGSKEILCIGQKVEDESCSILENQSAKKELQTKGGLRVKKRKEKEEEEGIYAPQGQNKCKDLV
ncbi:unnamed protein product [Ilex paraguariensis]|uniref:Uncharacterized protein n=1 Tax=Ilex paraguariensis TaxID=185542 RepID=A0ABC8S1L7_9AQUA